jgi:tetratricopeptide (TPR) repeat protein
MRIRLSVFVFAAIIALLSVTGCDHSDPLALTAEADDPTYRQAQQLEKQGHSQEALASYLKVIAKRGESAPESHLEAGLIYLEQIKDPIAAIYHLRKFLELQPNARQAVYVNGMVETAKREFARTLPARPLESQAERMDLLDQIGRLQRENDELKGELAALRNGETAPTLRTTIVPTGNTATRARAFITPPRVATGSPVSAVPGSARAPDARPTVQVTPPSLPASAPARPSPAAAGRTHIVQKGDTLFSLAQKYYGNRSKWRDIYEANRAVLPNQNALSIGMELKIP